MSEQSSTHHDPFWIEQGYRARFQNFQNLMIHRIRDILLVSSLYDFYIFEEDGRLYEMIRDKYQGLNLTHSPELTQVSSGKDALEQIREGRNFDLVVVTLHIEDMRPAAFARRLKEKRIPIPVVMLAFDNKELSDILIHHEVEYFDQIYIWQGDYRLILAMVKTMEDRLNVERDTNLIGVQSIIVIEDNILYYSSFLPMIYVEVMKHSQCLIDEGINLSHRRLRMRARPKILLCTTYEAAWRYFEKYQETVLGVISDIDFPKNGQPCPTAGIEFARNVKQLHSDISVLLHSTNPKHRAGALETGASFALKDSPTLLQELQMFMKEQLSFGDFVFYLPNGKEVGRAHDLYSLEKALAGVPEESIAFHAIRNHFSNWLKARTEFWLAHEIRAQHLSDYPTVEDTRQNLIQTIHEYLYLRQRGFVADFDSETFNPRDTYARIGGGSLGGKARGLGFVNNLISLYNLGNRFEGIRIVIPPAIVIGTDVFDRFLDDNDLRDFALRADSDEKVMRRFLDAPKFPEDILRQLAEFLKIVRTPLAVRSSSLLEDSHVHPFAGVYKTYMLPNVHPDPFARLLELVNAIKKVYASTFFQSAKHYVYATPYRLEEEKMGVIIQEITGNRYGDRFYPNFSGVIKSHNFYPIPPQKYRDGIVNVALGMGKTVVEGGVSVRFCPTFPHRLSTSGGRDAVSQSQRHFYAIDLTSEEPDLCMSDACIQSFDLASAEEDGTLTLLGSTYSLENDHVYDGIGREGIRFVSFAPLFKSKRFPLAEISKLVMDLGGKGMGTPVEVEFAVNLETTPREFAILQMRPIVLNRELEVLNIDSYSRDQMICQTDQVLGNDIIDNIHHILLVDRNRFDRSRSREVAEEVHKLNDELMEQEMPYLLIGVGRWGSLDPWLGIPVTWDQICGVRTIVEAGFRDFIVEPSQGSHFFQNLHSFEVGYFTVQSDNEDVFIDWDWLLNQKPVAETDCIRLLKFTEPVIIKMSAHQKRGIILKPGVSI